MNEGKVLRLNISVYIPFHKYRLLIKKLYEYILNLFNR